MRALSHFSRTAIMMSVVAVLIVTLLLWSFLSHEAAGPNSPEFKWEDYRRIESLQEFAAKHFPIGTHRSYIESLLVVQGKAKLTVRIDEPAPKLTTVSYRYNFGGLGNCSRGLVFVFNQHNETVYQSFPGNWVVTYRPFNIVGGCNGP